MPAEMILERRLRIGEDIERSWWFVRYLREFPLVSQFEGLSSTSYRCRNGHGWTTSRIDPCTEERCAHGKGLDEAIDRAKSRDKRGLRR